MFKNPRKNIVYLIVLFIPFYLYFNRSTALPSLRYSLVKVVSFPSRVLSATVLELKKIIFYQRIFNEYKRLAKDNNRLRAKVVDFEETSKENKRLVNLIGFKKKIIYPSVAAKVVAREPTSWNTSFVIDRGKKDGLVEGMPVVSDLGVVGKVAEVTDDLSKVILLTDYRFSVAATALEARESGLVSGTLQGLCRMRYLSEDAQIKQGDAIITSKLSSSFPEGLLIGEVISVYKSQDTSTLECLIRPAVLLSQVEEVLVILTPK